MKRSLRFLSAFESIQDRSVRYSHLPGQCPNQCFSLRLGFDKKAMSGTGGPLPRQKEQTHLRGTTTKTVQVRKKKEELESGANTSQQDRTTLLTNH